MYLPLTLISTSSPPSIRDTRPLFSLFLTLTTPQTLTNIDRLQPKPHTPLQLVPLIPPRFSLFSPLASVVFFTPVKGRAQEDMNWRRSPSAIAVFTIPLLLCLPQTLVAAFSVYDYVPSSLRSGWLRGPAGGGGSLVRRNELGYYNPVDYGGYMLTVSFPLSLSLSLSLSPLLPFLSRIWVSCRWGDVRSDRLLFPGSLSCRVVADDSIFLQSGRLGLENPRTRSCPLSRTQMS